MSAQESVRPSDVVERAHQALDSIETPTPWVAKWGGVYGTSGPKNTYRGTDGSPSVATAEGGFVEGEFLEGDADFIAAAPDLVSRLCAEVEALRVERDAAVVRAEGAEVAWTDTITERDEALAEVERLAGLLDPLTREYPQECNKRVRAERERDEALAVIERVRQRINLAQWAIEDIRNLDGGERRE